MVQLDYRLLDYAQRLFTDDNVQDLGQLIFAYQVAVGLHNDQQVGHEIYRMQSEVRLRQYVRKYLDESIRKQTEDAIRLALEGQAQFDSIQWLE